MTQPDALRLAERIDGWLHQDEMNIEDAMKAVTHLRHLHALNQELLEALERSRAQWIHSVNADRCLAAIAKAQQLLEVTPAQMAHAEAIAKR